MSRSVGLTRQGVGWSALVSILLVGCPEVLEDDFRSSGTASQATADAAVDGDSSTSAEAGPSLGGSSTDGGPGTGGEALAPAGGGSGGASGRDGGSAGVAGTGGIGETGGTGGLGGSGGSGGEDPQPAGTGGVAGDGATAGAAGEAAGAAGAGVGPACGNGVAELGEACDGSDLRGETCSSRGLGSGELGCDGFCAYDESDCAPLPYCGDGEAQGDEACDGDDLKDEDCEGRGYAGGTLACDADCEYSESECIEEADCDFIVEDGNMGPDFHGSTAGRTSSVRDHVCTDGGAGPDLSLAWTPAESGCYRISTFSQNDLDTILSVYDTCALSDELACDDNGGTDQFSQLQFEAVGGTTYAILVDSYFDTDAGSLNVTIMRCVP